MPTRTTVVAVALVVLCARHASAQTAPVVRAQSRVVTITDGLHVKKNYWYVMPERVPDVYHVEIPLQPHTVTFTTDRDTISFNVTFGSRHDFVIELADGRKARTQVRAEFKSLLSCGRTVGESPPGGDRIPFRLGDNDKIYVEGRINGGPVLNLQFDLGAGGSIIKKSSVSKVPMMFEDTIQLRNSDGVNTVPSSRSNRLELAGLRCDGIPFAVGNNMTDREDGLIGNALFQDKVVEIDHDRRVVAIHATLPWLSPDWIEEQLILDGVVPYVRGALSVDGVARAGWFLLDTGAYTSILNDARLAPATKVLRELRGLAGARNGPVLSVGGRTFPDPNYSAAAYDGDASALGLLGNDVLKRFNLMIDNRRGVVYFRPNAHLHEPFRNPEYYLVRLVAISVGLAAVALAVVIRRRRHR